MAATMEKISSDLKKTEAMKTTLHRAFTDLHSVSSSLSSFSLTWSEINSHFSSLHSHLEQRYDDLVSHVSLYPKQPSPPLPSSSSHFSQRITLLKSFCASMDGLGLRKYIVDRPLERKAMRNELHSALQSSPDPASLILSSLEGFFPQNPSSGKDVKLDNLRTACILLLEELIALKPEIKPEVQEKARELAHVWKEKAILGVEEKRLEAMGFLNLLAAYDMGSHFHIEDVISFFVSISKSFQAIRLCHQILTRESVPDLIWKLLEEEGKEMLALKYVFEFGLTEIFPPVPLLKAHVEEIKKTVARVVESGNSSLQSLNEATAREMSGLNQVIKLIEEKGLEGEYPKEELTKRVAELEKTKAERKRASKSTLPSSAPPQKRKKTTSNPPPKKPPPPLHSTATTPSFNRPSHYPFSAAAADTLFRRPSPSLYPHPLLSSSSSSFLDRPPSALSPPSYYAPHRYSRPYY